MRHGDDDDPTAPVPFQGPGNPMAMAARRFRSDAATTRAPRLVSSRAMADPLGEGSTILAGGGAACMLAGERLTAAPGLPPRASNRPIS